MDQRPKFGSPTSDSGLTAGRSTKTLSSTWLEKMGYELGVSHCPVVAPSQLSPKVTQIRWVFHHSSERAHASLGSVGVLLILFIGICCIHGGERYANCVGSLQFRGWDSLSLHVA